MPENDLIDPKKQGDAISEIGLILNKLNEKDRSSVIGWILAAYSSTPLTNNRKSSSLGTDSHGKLVNFEDIKNIWKQTMAKINDMQKATIIAYYLTKIEGKAEFSSEELKNAWTQLGRLPKSLPSTISFAINNYQYLVRIPSKQIYKITARGEQYVEELPTPSEELTGKINKHLKNKSRKVK